MNPQIARRCFPEGGFAHRVVLSIRRGTFFGDAMRSIHGRIRNLQETAAPQKQMDGAIEPRFFICHGVIHDGGRRHVYTNGEAPFENCLEMACKMLNTLSGPPFSLNSLKAASLAASIDAALSSAAQSVGVMDKQTAELVFLGPEVAGVLREIAAAAPRAPMDR